MNDKIFNGFPLANRPMVARKNAETNRWHFAHSDSLVMLSVQFEHIRVAMQRNAWPELFALLRAADDGKELPPFRDETVFCEDRLMEMLRRAHVVVADLLSWISADEVDAEGASDSDIVEALERVGWAEVPYPGRVGYLAMIGLYQLHQSWLVGWDRRRLPGMSEVEYESLVYGSAQALRDYDQGTDPKDLAKFTIKNAIMFAQQCGLNSQDIADAVKQGEEAYCNDEVINTKPLEGINDESSCVGNRSWFSRIYGRREHEGTDSGSIASSDQEGEDTSV